MSRTIDQQVVEMQFDNSHFERNVQQSMSTIDKLKQSLNLTGASKGLENINAAAKNNNFGVLGSSVEAVKVKFSALEVMGITALTNITNSAVNAGKRIVKSLTIDPVTSGFNEYELKMNSVQTIMASTGESLETVNKYLNELNEYSDKTIYSFSDMTQNIGKFTNAGVKLEDAVLAIKGISNEAAVSGANANEASRAMYNFAQALSAGYVKLIDWKSIENANMATVEFKEQLIQTAVELGTLKKGSDGLYEVVNVVSKVNATALNATKNFNDSLGNQWMTTDVLIGTLSKYASETTDIGEKATKAATEVKTFTQMMDSLKESAQSGWAQTWEIVFGSFYEAKDLWSDINDVVGGVLDKISDARNDMLKTALGSSWEDLTLRIEEAGLSAGKFSKELKKTLEDAGEPVEELEEEYGELSNAVKAGKVSADNIRKTLDKVIKTEEEAAEATGEVTLSVEELKKVSEDVMSGEFGNGAERLKALTEAGYDYATIQNKVNEVLGSSVKHFSELTEEQKTQLTTLANLSDAQMENTELTEEQKAALKELKKAAADTGGSINDLITDLERPSGRMLLIESFKNIWEEILKILETVGEAWHNVFGDDSDIKAGEGLYKLIEDFHTFTESLEVSESALGTFKATLEAIFNVSSITFKVMGKSVMAALTLLNAVLGLFGTDILKVAEAIANKINEIATWLNTEFLFGYKHTANLAKLITAALEGIAKVFNSFLKLDRVSAAMEHFRTLLRQVFDVDTLKGIADSISTTGLVAKVESIFNAVDKWVQSLNNSQNLLKDILSGIFQGFEWTVNGLLGTVDNIGSAIIKITAALFGVDPTKFLESWNKIIELFRFIGASIKEAVKSFAKLEPVQELLGKFTERIKTAWDNIKKAFSGDGTSGLDSFIKKVEDAFNALNEWIDGLNNVDSSELGSHIISGLAIGIGKGIKAVISAITTIATTVIETFCTILGINSPSKVMIALGGFIIAGLVAGLTQNTGEVGNFISNFGTTMIEWFKNMFGSIVGFVQQIDFGKVLAIALAGGLIFVIKKLADAIALFASPMDALTGVFKAVKGAISGVGDALKNAIKLRSKVEALKGMAIAIAILAGSLWLISQIDETRLYDAIGTLVVLVGLLAGLAWACEKLSKTGDFKKIGINSASIAAIAFTLLALAVSVKLLSDIKPERMLSGVLGFVGVCVAMVEVLKALSNVTAAASVTNFKGLGAVFTKFAIALLIMVGVIKLMASLKLTEVLEGCAYIIAIGYMFKLFTTSFKGLDANAISQVGWLALKMSVALLLMMAVIKIAASMNEWDVLKGAAVIVLIGVLFKAFVSIANGIEGANEIKSAGISKIGNLMLKFAVSLLIVAAAIKLLGSMSVEELAKGTAIIYAFGILMGALTYITGTKGYSAHKLGLMFIEFAAALLIISIVILLLKEIVADSDGLPQALGVITLIGAIFAALIWATGAAGDVKGPLITLTVAIGILAVALVALSLLDSTKVAIAAGALVGVIGVFALLIKATSSINTKEMEFVKVVGVLALLLGTVIVLGFLIKELAVLDPERALATAESLGVLLLSLSASMWILSHTKGLTLNDLSTAIIGIAGLSMICVMLATLIRDISVTDPSSAIPMATAIGILLLTMSASLNVISYSKSLKPDSLLTILPILGTLMVAILTIGYVIKELNGIDPGGAMANAKAIGNLLLALSVSFAIISYSKSISVDNILGIFATLGMLELAIYVIGDVIKKLDGINPVGALASAVAIGVVLLALSASFAIIAYSPYISKNSILGIVATLAMLEAAIYVIGDVIKKLDGIDPGGAVASAIAIGTVLLALSAAFSIIAYSPSINAKELPSIVIALGMLTIVAGLIGQIIGKVSEYKPENAIDNAIAISALVLALSVAMIPLSLVGKLAPQAAKGALALATMAVPLATFGYALTKLKPIPSGVAQTVDTLTEVMTAMTLLLIPLTAIGAIVAFTGGLGGLGIIAGILALCGMVVPLATFAEELNKLPDMTGNFETIDKLMSIMVKMEEMLIEVSSFGLSANNGVHCIKTMINIVKELAIFAGVIGGLTDTFPKLKTFLDSGIDTLIEVGEGFGKVVGSFVTGLGDTVMGALPGYGDKLSEFMDNAGDFISTAQSLGSDNTIVTGAKNMADAIIALIDAGSSDFWSMGSMTGLGEQLAGFMTQDVKDFFTDIKGIDEGAIAGAKNVAETVKALADAALTDTINGLFNWGDSDWSSFGEQLAAFGTAMVEFDNAIAGHTFDEDSIKAAKAGAEIMLELQKGLQATGGVLEVFKGKQDLGDFGTQMKYFGQGIRAFSDEVSDGNGGSALNTEAIEAAKGAGDMMSALQDAIDPMDGLWQKISGTTDLKKFGEKIEAYGASIVAVSKALVGDDGEILVNTKAVEAAQKAGELLAAVQAAIPEDSWGDGKISIDEFGENVYAFGGYLKGYADRISEIENGDVIAASLEWSKQLVQIANQATYIDEDKITNFGKIEDIGAAIGDYYDNVSDVKNDVISKSITNAKGLVKLINSLSELKTGGIENFKTAVSDLGNIDINGVADAFNESLPKLSNIGSSMIDNIVKGMNAKKQLLATTVLSLVDALNTSFTSKAATFNSVGISYVQNIIIGALSQQVLLISNMLALGNAGATGAKMAYTSFYNAGKYVVEGFAYGIRYKQQAAVNAAISMAKAAADAANEYLKINSPSKIFMAIGSGVVEGFVKGIDDNTSSVVSSATEMADTARSGFSRAIGKVSDLLSGEMDAQPTIRPVLDLSDIQSGAATIGSMFGNPSIGVMSNLGSINTMMNRRNQNGANDDVVSAINRLESVLGGLGGDSYTIGGITYDDGSAVSDAVKSLIRAANIGRRV